jgi:hypothetical protein
MSAKALVSGHFFEFVQLAFGICNGSLTDQAPYAPTDAVVTVIEKYRETGLGGTVITVELLNRLGMGDEVARRTVLSLKMLELLDDEARPTANLIAIKQASSEAYRGLFAQQLYDLYGTVFAILGKDPAENTASQIEDAFRTFRPDSLRKRMVTLFLGLCQYSGIIADVPKSKPGPKGGITRKPRPAGAGRTPPPPPPPPPTTSNGDSYTVDLRSGGVVTLGVSVKLFDLTTEDREFVLGLIDKVKEYGSQKALLPGAEPHEN